MSTNPVYSYDDVIDVRDIIESVTFSDDDSDENTAALELLEELKGNGGDIQWQGDWYPCTLIRDSYFTTYAQELADDIGAGADGAWPYSCIDWERAAHELQMDYTTVEYEGVTYWYR